MASQSLQDTAQTQGGSTYFAAREANETVSVLLAKANAWFHNLDTSGYLDKLREMWAAYHGAYYSTVQNGHKISFSGEQGELANLPVNHLRNIGQNILVMITATRPAMEARSVNTDYKSLIQTKLANGLLDYYMREKRLERYLKTAVEYAIVLGSGYIKMEWNATGGEIYDHIDPEIDPDTGETINPGFPVYEGDVNFVNLSPFDVCVDSTKEGQHNDWILVRSYKNKFDLAAKYPEQADRIKGMPSKTEYERYRFNSLGIYETDDIPIYEFYHKKTESMPDGRYLMFLDYDLALMDTPMPYDDLPVFRISCSDIIGTPYGYTPLFDLLPIQDAVNMCFSTVLSNQSAFGVQSIMMPRGTDINPSNLVGGLNLIEYNAQVGKPEPLQLTATPPEIFSFMQMLIKEMETLSGVSSVARGNPPENLKSGNALALLQSMSLQYQSGLQQAYVNMIEDVGTNLIKMLQRFAHVPRIAMIVGKHNKLEMKEFNGDDLSQVTRVVVDMGNALAACLAKDTPVLMFDGSIKVVQDIGINDEIMGPDSQKRTIKNINSGEEMMYNVISKDKYQKVNYTVNESHILTLKYCSDDRRYKNAKKGNIIDISIKDYLKLSSRHKRLLQGFKTGIDFSKKPLTIPPYILGAWLGDGTSAAPALTTMDAELLKEWSDYAHSIGMEIRISTSESSGKAKTYFITSGQSHGKSDRNPFMNELRSMEVLNNKHIPNLYLTSNRQDRLELLAGLIDTDGTRNGETFLFSQKDNRLTDQVIYLSRSLGFKTTYKKVKYYANRTKGALEGEGNLVSIGGNTWEIPTRLPRKQAIQKEKQKDWLNYGINVIPVKVDTYYGFTLKEEPHFILGDFTVTHNTTAGKVEMAEQLLQMGLLKSPEEYLMVIKTGQLDTMTDDTITELMNIRSENEDLVDGGQVTAILTDQHSLHIKEHKSVLADPDLRKDPDLVKRTLDHIQQHIQILKTGDPQTLMMMGEKPLSLPPAPDQPPQGPTGPPQGPPTPGGPPHQGPPPPHPGPGAPQGPRPGIKQAGIPGPGQNVQAQPLNGSANSTAAQGIRTPGLPKPPGQFANMPVLASQMKPQS